jgi:hypothetical protein
MTNRIYILIIIVLGLGSCTKDFTELNTNPNAPVDVQPEFLLRHVIFDYGEQMSYEGFVAGSLLGQYFTAVDFNLFDRHDLSSPQFGGNPWDFMFTNLRDNQIILDKAQESETFRVYEGPALILKAFIVSNITDIYGNAPYLEAVSGRDGLIAPRYDDQEDIYTGESNILGLLEQAITSIDTYTGNATLDGDIFFDGDLSAWRRFANSLRIKFIMRMSDVNPQASTLQAIFDEGDYFTDLEMSAKFDFTNDQPNNFRMANLRIGDFSLFIMSETIQEILENYDDPRIATFFRPSANNDAVFAGLLNGPDASQTSITVGDFSFAGRIFREETGRLDANFLTSFETLFFLAEAAQKGFINADAQALYEEGVRQAFEFWGTSMPADYLQTGSAAFGQGDPLQQIITQKWLANLVNGYEGWIEYRRTGFPELKTISASLNNNLIPVRMPYPQSEEALNGINFEDAAARSGNNSINAKVWWDVD